MDPTGIDGSLYVEVSVGTGDGSGRLTRVRLEDGFEMWTAEMREMPRAVVGVATGLLVLTSDGIGGCD